MKEHLVVVFGGAGYLGSVLVRLLLQEGFPVRVFDNFTYGRDSLRGLLDAPEYRGLLEVVEGDICHIEDVSSACEGVENVVLLSAVSGHRVQEIRNDSFRTINLLASSTVLDAAIEHGAERFIFTSTDSVYGIQSGVIYESTTPEPISLYTRLKLRMEERCLAAKKRGIDPVILRISNCHGYSPRMRFDLFANKLIRDAVCNKLITIRAQDQMRSFIHVEDSARAIVLALKAHENLVSEEIFNVSSPEQNIHANQLANIVRALVPETEVKILGEHPDVIDYRLNCSKIQKLLDFSPRWTLEQSLTQVRDLLQQGYFEQPFSVKYLST